MLFYPAVAELVDLIDQSVEELAVVRNDDHRAVVFLQGVFEDVLRAHVHVVGRLVEYQQVVGLEHQPCHRQPGPLAARKHLHLLVDVFAAEQECPENVAQFCPYVAYRDAVQRVENCEVAVHQVVLVLRIVADMYVVSDAYHSARGFALADHEPGEGRLAFPVAADERHFFSPFDGEGRIRKDVLFPETLAGLFRLDDHLSRARAEI